ncbi:hypothetical protein TNCV_967711 [Trichonephila clavipes]|nr:hypothetical protein TNCV_967711 [Trichonephila clavipes]
MDVYKCIELEHGGILNSRRTAGPHVRLKEERWNALDHSQGVLPQNWGGTARNRIVICMVLKAKADGRRII